MTARTSSITTQSQHTLCVRIRIPELPSVRYVFVSQTFSGISFSIAVNTEMSVFRSVIG